MIDEIGASESGRKKVTALRLGLAAALVALLPSCGGATPEAQAPSKSAPTSEGGHDDRGGEAAEESWDEDASEQESRQVAPGAAPAPEPAPPPQQRISADSEVMVSELEFERLAEQLSTALSNADCGAAERFRDNICDLADKICELAEDLPSSHANGRCEDGKQRCESARARVSQRCE